MPLTRGRMHIESKEKLNDAKVKETMAKREDFEARKNYQVKKNTLAHITILKE